MDLDALYRGKRGRYVKNSSRGRAQISGILNNSVVVVAVVGKNSDNINKIVMRFSSASND